MPRARAAATAGCGRAAVAKVNASRASPGMLLLTDVVRRAAVDRLDRIEFLGKDAPWTAFWTTELRAHTRLHYYPGTPTGLASLLRDGTRVVLRRLRRRLLNRG